MKEMIRAELEKGNMKAIMAVRKFGGLDAMTDEQIAQVARKLHLAVKSNEQIAYEAFMTALRGAENIRNEIAQATEAKLHEFATATVEDTTRLEELLAENIRVMKDNYELANKWYGFTNHGDTLYPIM